MKQTVVPVRSVLALALLISVGCRKQEATENSPPSAEPTPLETTTPKPDETAPDEDMASETADKKSPDESPATQQGLVAEAEDAGVADKAPTTDAASPEKVSTKRRTRAEKERDEVVAMLLEPRLFSMTPNEAAAHYSGLGFEREESVPGSVDLIARLSKGGVKIGYVQQDNKMVFTNARFEFPGADAAEAEQSFRAMSEIVRARLGEPKDVMAKRPFLGEVYTLSDKLEAYVGAVMGEVQAPHSIISITLPETK